MPATRRSTSGSGNKQATLSFNHKVTKSVPKSTKNISSAPTKQSPLAKHVANAEPAVKENDIDVDVEEKAQADKHQPVVPVHKKTKAELRADKISDRQISRYWRGVESERRTKTVHQEGLSMAEKILRYWDVNSQYGPCVGISRVKRWQRADRLGLNPPIEVLAVLMDQEKKGVKNIQMAHMDEILNSALVEGN
ncbi:DNA polymerase delta, subunit 4-domain-containing protein [Xylaria sp. CBS 124048]|nr:DNA polymerase delta, subunit 4-domain-containing protein [Xylaria sp. CBS 124048]